MLPASRRIFFYWLLLLLPTLVVGAGAILLLRREQTRLAERSNYADEARRAAVAARARLVAENVELLTGDVQNGLLDALAAEPADGIDAFLDQWEKSNPFVRTAFRSSMNGRLIRPINATANEDGKGFLRRFGRRLNETPPWGTVAEKEKAYSSLGSEMDQLSKREENAARQQVVSNVAKLQSARRDAQQLSRQRNASNAYESTVVAADRASMPAAAVAPAAEFKAGSTAPILMQAAPVKSPSSPERRGWQSWVVDGRIHLLGWVQPAGATEIRGVELELAALIGRLGGTLPAEVDAGEGYALRDEQGRVLHQVGAVVREQVPAVLIPLSAEALPGWDVVAFLPPVSSLPADFGGSFFFVGCLLLGIFVTAIVAGGSLLLWQARRSEAEAAQKTSFVANVSHEFKTPLTTIRLYSELLEQGRVRDAVQGGEYLRTIGRETERLTRLVGNALDFSRLEQGKKKFAREPVELATTIARLLDVQAPRLAEAGLALTREWPTVPLRVETDRDALEQIFLNLLENACKYAAGGGELTVILKPGERGGATLVVLDRGPGVPPEHRERIFEKFHRVDDTLTAEKSGAGLGLSIARQLARGLGGELRYVEREGGGAGFELTLP